MWTWRRRAGTWPTCASGVTASGWSTPPRRPSARSPWSASPCSPAGSRRELEPGLYLVTAYGGPAQPWAEEAEAHPFYMRFGLPRLPEAGRRRFTVSPFGIDRYRVPGAATYFRLELPEARPATPARGHLRSRAALRRPGRDAGDQQEEPASGGRDRPAPGPGRGAGARAGPRPHRDRGGRSRAALRAAAVRPTQRLLLPRGRELLAVVRPLGPPAGLGGRDRAPGGGRVQGAAARGGGGGRDRDRAGSGGPTCWPP